MRGGAESEKRRNNRKQLERDLVDVDCCLVLSEEIPRNFRVVYTKRKAKRCYLSKRQLSSPCNVLRLLSASLKVPNYCVGSIYRTLDQGIIP